MNEYLTDPKNKRFSILPVKEHDVYNMYKTQLAMFWQPEEIDFSTDKYDYDELTKDEQHIINTILCFFANSDGLVCNNIKENLNSKITIAEINLLYDFISTMENIHNITYGTMIEELITDDKTRIELFEAMKTKPIIKKISDWSLDFTNNSSLAENLLAYICFEGIIFSSIFAVIFYIKDKYKGRLRGFVSSNDFIARDEAAHVDTGILIYSKLYNKLDKSRAIEIIEQSVMLSLQLADECLNIDHLGLTRVSLHNYIKYVADRIAYRINGDKIYNASNPFSFMNVIGLTTKTNFFEKRPTEYQSATINNDFNLSVTVDF